LTLTLTLLAAFFYVQVYLQSAKIPISDSIMNIAIIRQAAVTG